MEELLKIVTYLARKKIFLVGVFVITILTYFVLYNLDDRKYSATVSFDRNVLPSQYMLFCGFSETCVDTKLYAELEQHLLKDNPLDFQTSALDLRRHFAVLSFDRQPAESDINAYFLDLNRYFTNKVLSDEKSFSENIDQVTTEESKYYRNNFLPSLKINSLTTIDILSKEDGAVFNFQLVNILDNKANFLVLGLISLSFGIFLSAAFLIIQYEISRRSSTTSA